MFKFKKLRNGFSISRKVKGNITPQPVIRYFSDYQIVRFFIGVATYDIKIPFLPTAYVD